MIELDRHIEILLLNNDCVIVPGLGGFMAHHVEARYDEDGTLFLPPLRTIGFNPKILLNDSLLALSYVDAYDISYPDAMNRIDDEVAELKQHLEHEGSYELNGIGVLSLDANGHYLFEPCEAGIITPSLFALDAFEMKTLEALAREDELLQPSSKKTTAEADSADSPQQPSTPLGVSERLTKATINDDDDSTVSIRISVLRNLAAASIAIIAFFLFATPLGTSTQSSLQQAGIDTSMLMRIMPKELVTIAPATSALAAADSAKVASEQAKADAETAEEDATAAHEYYCIVLASHVSVAGAEAYAANLQKQGLADARMLRIKGESTKVVCGEYDSKEEAQSALTTITHEQGLADGWVLKVNQ